MGYWVNFDTTRVTMHREDCVYVGFAGERKNPRNGKWKAFNTKEDIYKSTARGLHECGTCMP